MTKYQHCKGGIYTIITFAQHTETGDDLVVYQNDKGEVFARPHDMFFGDVVVDGDRVPRFREVKTMKGKWPGEDKENYMNDLLKKCGRNG